MPVAQVAYICGNCLQPPHLPMIGHVAEPGDDGVLAVRVGLGVEGCIAVSEVKFMDKFLHGQAVV